jgi:hypothetical protein
LVGTAGKFNLEGANAAGGLSGALNRSLLNGPVLESLLATLRHEFSPQLQAFLDVGASRYTGHFQSSAQVSFVNLPAASAANPFSQPITATFPLINGETELFTEEESGRAVAGVILGLPHDWHVELDLTYDRNRFRSSFPQLSGALSSDVLAGEVDVLRDLNRYPVDFSKYVLLATAQSPIVTEMKVATARGGGPVWNLAGGPVIASTLVERRREVYGESTYLGSSASAERTQDVNSVYAELKLPLVAPANHVRGVYEAELQIAARYDDYRTTGSNTAATAAQVVSAQNHVTSANPTIGFRYRPVPDVMLRASYGTGFLPPNVAQLVGSPVPFGNPGGFITDPRRGNTAIGPFTYTLGGSSSLVPEDSTTWSGGIVVTPQTLPAFRFSADWTRIEKDRNIAELGFADLVANEAFLPGRITRGSRLPGDPPEWAGPITSMNLTLVNIARAEIEAWDFALDYKWDAASAGSWGIFAAATHTLHYRTRIAPNSPVVDNVGDVTGAGATVGTPNFPLEWKGNLGLSWSRGPWLVGWTMRYYDSYSIRSTVPGAVEAQGGEKVPAQVYHDVVASYRFGTAVKVLQRTEIQAGVRNIFNREPPFDVVTSANLYSGFGDPRLASYYITLKHAF